MHQIDRTLIYCKFQQQKSRRRNFLRRLSAIYSLYRLAKHLTQQVCHALRSLDGGDHQQVAIHLRPVEVMSRAADELRQERPLGASVSLAEGVQVVGGVVEIGDLLHEGVMGQAFEVILLFQPVKNQLGLRFDLPGRAEICPLLAEVHRTDLPRTIVQVREKKLMDRLVVGEVKNAFQRALFQLGGVDIGGESLRLLQRGLVMDMQFIHQHSCAGVAVVLNGIDAVAISSSPLGWFGKTPQQLRRGHLTPQHTLALLPHLGRYLTALHADGGLRVLHGKCISFDALCPTAPV